MSEATVVLEAQALAKHYPVSTGFLKPKALARALDGVSFTLAAGKTLAVVGESGCGKSTLARQLTMIELPTGGALLLDGADVTRADTALKRQLRQQVQMVFQNPFASLNPRKKIGHALEEPLVINTPLGATERGERACAMMARVGLRPEHHARYPHMFSGGQRRLRSMGGMVPGAFDRPSGCLLSPRCAYVQPRCREERPALDGDLGMQARCFYPLAQVTA